MKTIVHIISFSHSGSTLLGNILGAHSKILHIGELAHPVKDNHAIICRECLEKECPIWGNQITVEDLHKEYNYCTQSNTKMSKLQSLIFKLKQNPVGKIYSKLFNGNPNIEFIIDGSKNIPWSKYQSKHKKNFQFKFIFLSRNPKAVIASPKRKYKHAVDWQIKNLLRKLDWMNEFFEQWHETQKIKIRYEDLILNFDMEVRRICKFLAVPYEQNMMHFNEYPHHLIGGNVAGYIQKDKNKGIKVDGINGLKRRKGDNKIDFFSSFNGLKLDERWKEDLTKEEKKKIDDSFNPKNINYWQKK